MISTRMGNISNLVRYGRELKVIIPMEVFRERNNELFKDQQEALENLKNDPQLKIVEDEIKNEVVSIDGTQILNWYKIITIIRKQ